MSWHGCQRATYYTGPIYAHCSEELHHTVVLYDPAQDALLKHTSQKHVRVGALCPSKAAW
jgi:hypothetical protein